MARLITLGGEQSPAPPKSDKKIKVLWLSDFLCSTGFAQVAHNLAKRLIATGKYDLTVIGINYHGEPYDFTEWPIPIYPAIQFGLAMKDQRYQDVFGRQRVLDLLGTGEFDLFFSLQDSFIMEQIAAEIVDTRKQLLAQGRKAFRWIYYFPVDSILRENWVTKSIALADFPVAYTQFGEEQVHRFDPKLQMKVIYHGIDPEVFKPMPDAEVKDFRRNYFSGLADNKFLITNINRNQPRKDIPRTIAAYAEFRKLVPQSHLYLHMKASDAGGDIREMARHFGLREMEDYSYPRAFNENAGLPLPIVNFIYNASDVVTSTTLGEGWGLSSIEAMATKTPVIFPDNTSLKEICADGRGTLVPSGVNPSDWINLGAIDMCQYRPMTSVPDLVAALKDHYDHPGKAMERAEKAYAWVQANLSWDTIAKEWDTVFAKAVQSLTPSGIVTPQTVGRNDPCPICQASSLDVKWKKCKKHNPDFDLVKEKYDVQRVR